MPLAIYNLAAMACVNHFDCLKTNRVVAEFGRVTHAEAIANTASAPKLDRISTLLCVLPGGAAASAPDCRSDKLTPKARSAGATARTVRITLPCASGAPATSLPITSRLQVGQSECNSSGFDRISFKPPNRF